MEGRTGAAGVTYVDIAPATESHPRNDSASIVQLDDGSLFIVWIEMRASRLGGHDEAPSGIASMRSDDGGHTWGEHRVEQSPGGEVHSVYNPSLILLPDGELLFFYLQYAVQRVLLQGDHRRPRRRRGLGCLRCRVAQGRRRRHHRRAGEDADRVGVPPGPADLLTLLTLLACRGRRAG